MAGRLQGKVAVITGGASGMGRETALRFLSEGARVLIADLNIANAEATLAIAGKCGQASDIQFLRTDVSREDDIVAMIDTALEAFGRLDCLFNNAGVAGAMGPIADMDVADWDRTQAILLRSVFLGIKYGARAMRRQGSGGVILNTSSIAGLAGGAPSAYGAAKAGVENLTRNAAVEFAPDRIRVNTIAPGVILTPLIPVPEDADVAVFTKGRQPWPDSGKASDIASAALFLASDEARFCTGITLLVDGGILAWGPGMFPNANASIQSGFSAGNTGESSEQLGRSSR